MQFVGLLLIAIIVGLGIGLAVRSSNKKAQVRANEPPAPIGRTPDGEPIYPVVGYTPDGQPITADRALGMKPEGTNSMAITALVTGLTVAPLGIIFGHIALSQIKRTSQDGKGLAVAGLVLGYVGLVSWIVIIAVTVAGAKGAL